MPKPAPKLDRITREESVRSHFSDSRDSDTGCEELNGGRRVEFGAGGGYDGGGEEVEGNCGADGCCEEEEEDESEEDCVAAIGSLRGQLDELRA